MIESRDFLGFFRGTKKIDFRLMEKKGVGFVKKLRLICGLLCLLCLSGCGKRDLLSEKLDVAEVDKVVVTLAMGNPAYGALCKVITDPQEVQDLVYLFNHAKVDEKIDSGEEWVAGSGSYTFFSGEEQIIKFNVNGNDSERIWINDAFYEIEYPEDRELPFVIYALSDAEVIIVDEYGQEMVRSAE